MIPFLRIRVEVEIGEQSYSTLVDIAEWSRSGELDRARLALDAVNRCIAEFPETTPLDPKRLP